MYLVSLYFDDNTNKRILRYMQNVAEKSGNEFMLVNDVPSHLTVSAFETKHVETVLNSLNNVMEQLLKNKIKWVAVGTFPTVIFIQPILNEYLHNLSVAIYEAIKNVPDVKISRYYKPLSWIPHTTIAKQLSEDAMCDAFDVLQKSFAMFEGEVVRIELAKKKPFQVLASWEL